MVRRRSQYRVWYPYTSPLDPCPAIREKVYNVPPELFVGFQRPNLPQFPPSEALLRGTLWPIFFAPYPPIKKGALNDERT